MIIGQRARILEIGFYLSYLGVMGPLLILTVPFFDGFRLRAALVVGVPSLIIGVFLVLLAQRDATDERRYDDW